MDLIKGIAALLIILSILVVVHEWGHYVVAKLFKMRVEEFSLFFGKVILKLGVRHGTVYNIRALPLGGFVKIAGMEADDISGGRPILEAIRNPLFSDSESMDKVLSDLETNSMVDIDTSKISDEIRKTVQDAISVDNNRLTPNGLADLEALKTSPRISTDDHKLIDLVLLAHARATDPGLYSQKPIYQRALVIFAGPMMSLLFGYFVYCIMGMTIGLPRFDKPLTNQIQVVPDSKSPATLAGLHSGDRIVALDGIALPTKLIVDKIHHSVGVLLKLTVERDGQTLDLNITPRSDPERDPKTGKVIGQIGRIGIVFNPAYERTGPIESLKAGTYTTKMYMSNLFHSIFTNARASLGGPIAMGQMATAAQRMGMTRLFEMAAMFSLSLGIMNLLPIPILDGGHLLLLAVEKIRRRKLSPREVYRAQMVGIGLLALLVAFVFYNDIIRTVHGQSLQ